MNCWKYTREEAIIVYLPHENELNLFALSANADNQTADWVLAAYNAAPEKIVGVCICKKNRAAARKKQSFSH